MVHRAETTPSELRERLELLNCELAAAGLTELADDSPYMQDLLAELRETRGALLIASVTEIALRRAAVFGQLRG